MERVTVRSLRELDALVAEHVMGLPNEIAGAWRNYSTSIADAWQVVDKLKHRTPVVEALPHADQGSSKWRCLFADINEAGRNNGWYIADAPTAPIAICLAALKTVNVEVTLELGD